MARAAPLHDDAGEFVSQDRGWLRALVLPLVNREIGSADPRVLDFQDGLAVAALRFLDVVQSEFMLAMPYQSLHGCLLLNVSA
jgi:hypothetical protein